VCARRSVRARRGKARAPEGEEEEDKDKEVEGLLSIIVGLYGWLGLYMRRLAVGDWEELACFCFGVVVVVVVVCVCVCV